MKYIKYVKKIERKIFSNILESEDLNKLEKGTDKLFTNINNSFKVIKNLLTDEKDLLKKYINKDKL